MIERLKTKNFTCLGDIDIAFSPKVNIILGDNGRGKTHLLKLIYAMSKYARYDQTKYDKYIYTVSKNGNISVHQRNYLNHNEVFESIFHNQTSFSSWNNHDYGYFCSMEYDRFQDKVHEIRLSTNKYSESPPPFSENHIEKIEHIPVFMPSREMLSIYPGFISLASKFQLPYDQTYEDMMFNLGLPYLSKMSEQNSTAVELIKKLIGGTIQLIHGQYFIMEDRNNHLQDINMISEGWRKLGMLMQLLRVGALEKGSTLLWDDMESNLSQSSRKKVFDIIKVLADGGIQVIMTTRENSVMRDLDKLLYTKECKCVNHIVLQKNKIKQGDSYYGIFPERAKYKELHDMKR